MGENGKSAQLDSELTRLREENGALRRELDELRERRARLAPEVFAALIGMPVVLWAIDADGTITMSEGRGLESLQLEPGQLVGSNVFELYDDPEVLEPIRRALLGERGYSSVAVGGAWWENRYFPEFDEGRVVGIHGLSLDVSAQRQAEDATRFADQKWRSLVENAPDRIFIADRDLEIIFANRTEDHASTADIVGRSVFEFIGERDHEAARAAFKATFDGQAGQRFDSIYDRSDGGHWWFENRLAPIVEDGTVTGVIIVASDVTDRTVAESEKAQLEAQVQHAQKLESLGVLAGGIAHDFNNLLVGIMGHAELASLQLGPESHATSHIEGIISASSRASDLCEQMLSYAGKGRLQLRDVNLSDLTADIQQLLNVTLDAGISFDQQLDPFICPIEGDPAQLQQVVMNLITNASDALRGRPGYISLRTGCGVFDTDALNQFELVQPIPAGQYAYIEVADTGEGMNEDTRLKMFDPFYTTKTSGRGLGMASVLGIVAGHNGAISVRSEPQQGTTVRVLFPAKARAADPLPGAHDEASERPIGAGRTILLVDDEPAVRNVSKRMLELLGFDTIVACNGEEALTLHAEHGPTIDLVMLDLTMPVMGGLDAAEHLMASDPAIRILLTSGYSADATQLPDAVCGMLHKPYRAKDLRAKLAAILNLSA